MTTIPNPLLPQTTTNNHLFAAIDLGTNSFKLRIVQANPTTGRFLTLHRLKHPSPTSLSPASQSRALHTLHSFHTLLLSLNLPSNHLRLVATSAIRHSPFQSQFIQLVHHSLGLQIDVVSGFEEARLTYLGVLQFHPFYNFTILNIDIGGGSTEFVIGFQGHVKLGVSLKLGHLSLTQHFVNNKNNSNSNSKGNGNDHTDSNGNGNGNGNSKGSGSDCTDNDNVGGNNVGDNIVAMREYIQNVVKESGLIEKVKEHKIDVVVGSSGSIRMIEKAIYMGYSAGLVNEIGLMEGCRRDWKFSKGELKGLVERLLCEEENGDGRRGFFKGRSAYIVAAVVLLDEIFGMLGVEEMEVSGYALGEGVIAEKLGEVYEGFDLNANARWRSVLRLAARFNNKKRMTSAAACASISQEIFIGLRKCSEIDVLLDEKDLEYLEAACLLHNIGLVTGKKGYHKRSYHIIMNGEHLHGYNAEEVKLIALLVRHHRKKFLQLDHDSLMNFTDEVKHKFIVLCVIIRLSAILKQYQSLSIQSVQMSHSHEGFKLVFRDTSANNVESIPADVDEELRKELQHFETVIGQKLSVVVLSSTSS